MIFIAVANVLAITRNYSPKIALRVHLLDAMKTGASSTVANGRAKRRDSRCIAVFKQFSRGPDEECFPDKFFDF